MNERTNGRTKSKLNKQTKNKNKEPTMKDRQLFNFNIPDVVNI